MRLQGTMDIQADRERVFAFLTDPDRIGPCLPKVQQIRKLPDGRFEAIAKVGKGFLAMTFTMTCQFTERTPPSTAAIRATGKAKGSAVDGTARMELRELPSGGTAVDWTADVEITGLAAKVGRQRLESGAQQAITQTLKRVRKQLKAGG
ncbi:MAG: carbon monoxide dehydrogenase subunit G [Chloroflexota bacterium]